MINIFNQQFASGGWGKSIQNEKLDIVRRLIRPLNLHYLVLNKWLRTWGIVLDVGCGAAYYISLLSKRGFPVIGIDISKEAIKIAKNNVKKGDFILCDGHFLPFKSEVFDYIISFDVMEHVRRPIKVLREIKTVIKSGGNIILQYETSDRIGSKSVKLDRLNPTKVSWLKGIEMKCMVSKFFKINAAFYGGQLRMIVDLDSLLSKLCAFRIGSLIVSTIDTVIALISGSRVKGVWLFLHARNIMD